MSGGGGSSNTYYSNLNELYAKQGAQLDRLMQIQDRNVIPGYDALSREAQQTGGIGEQNAAASGVITQGRGELAAAKEATSRDLTSMGVNPNDARFVAAERGLDVAGAGQIAAGANTARTAARNLGFARRKDVVGMGMGIPGQASEQMSAMGSTIGQQISARNQQDQARNAGLTSLGTLGTMALMMKDGGRVRRRGIYMASGGKACASGGKKMARGGPVGGFFQPINAPQAPASAPQQPTGTGLNPVSAMIMAKGVKGSSPMGDKAAALAENLNARGGHIAAKIGNLTGNQELTNQGVERVLTSRGLDAESAHNLISGPQGLSPAPAGYTAPVSGPLGGIPEVSGAAPATAAAPAAEAGIGSLPGSVTPAAEAFGAGLGEAAIGEGVTTGMGAAAGAEAAGAAGAATAGTAAAGAGTAALGAISAAMPWIGAGIAVGSMLGMFADGGKVDMRRGGDVSGPGTGTSDSIPAHLSDGEYVLNAEAVKLVGEDKLNAINRAGLAARKGGVRMADGGGIGSAGSLAEGIIRGMGISRQFENQNQERHLRDLQMQQAQLGIEGAQSDLEEKRRIRKSIADVQAGMSEDQKAAGITDLTQATDNQLNTYRSLVAQRYAKSGLLKPEEQMAAVANVQKLAKEGAFKAIQLDAQTGGNSPEVIAELNRLGYKVSGYTKKRGVGADGLPDIIVSVSTQDGGTMDLPLSQVAIDNGIAQHYLDARKAAQESAKAAAEIDYRKAGAQELRDRWGVRKDIADEKNQTALDAASLRGGAAGVSSAARVAAGEIKRWSEFKADLFKAPGVPQVPAMDAEGRPIMQGMNAVYRPDPKAMDQVFTLADAHRQQIERAGLSPEQFGQIAADMIKAKSISDPTQQFEAFNASGRLVIKNNPADGLPVRAAVRLGTDPEKLDKDGRPMPVDIPLPREIEKRLINEEMRRRKSRPYVDEGSRGAGAQPAAPAAAVAPPSRSSSGIIPRPGQYGEAEARRLLGG